MFSKQISGTKWQFFKTKSDKKIHQNAPNYIIFINFLGDHAPNPLTKRMEQHAN